MPEGPRIYNLFPLLVGPVERWKEQLPRIAGMGFNWVYVNPFHYPGFSGSLYAVMDYYRLNPIFRGPSGEPDDELLRGFTEGAEGLGLAVMMDLVINHTSRDCALVEEHPAWYAREADGSIRSPSAIDPADARKVTVWGDLAEIDYTARPERAELASYWQRLVRHYAGLGFRGFRCDAAYKVPAQVWRGIVSAAREVRPDAIFAAETLGCRLEEIEELKPVGFDYLFNSAKWWDFRADWLLEQYESFRHVAPSIAFPESHDTERLASGLAGQGTDGVETMAAQYRLRYLFAAAFSTGVMMPIGYEFGFRRKLDVVRTRPQDWEEPSFDLSAFIAAVNRMKAGSAVLNEEGPQRRLALRSGALVALLREAESGGGRVLTVINPDPRRSHTLSTSALAAALDGSAAGEEITPHARGEGLRRGKTMRLEPLQVRLFGERDGGGEAMGTRKPGIKSLMERVQSAPIIIENVYPELDCGRFPVKREVGDVLEVWADIFREGHDVLAAVVKYREAAAAGWREAPMKYHDNDRWVGRFPLQRNTRYDYTIEAWSDEFESRRNEMQKKRDAGEPVSLELAELRGLVEAALERARAGDRDRLKRVLRDYDGMAGDEERAALLLSTFLRQVMARCPEREGAVRYHRDLEVVVDRERARFAAWYEMFPRSQGTRPGQSATFKDCERRLPELQRMGFDVIYLVPIHPIGRTQRKGPNNTLLAAPDHPGSPYAIGAEEGGHDAVHPELGTLEDFRRFVKATRDHGMEVSLDIALQCSPDHPWIREHPEWFAFRPDGTIKFAENPPKKYQDIVSLNFYGAYQAEIWLALRDLVLFWIEQGVRIFRVDNPHSKPIPFWEWLIREVQTAHPDVIFLSEAFTRPKLLQMLAKVGFTQSYTYFTWRNFKGELTAYLTELTRGEVKEYLRPNFFTNTPDILPPYLQTGGRPAFKVRLVLAATLSSLYGIYNGFELCENRAVPGTEEYLDSEKYDWKVWDWDRPGNIKDYISKVNRIRRENPALHEFENLRFYTAQDEDVLFYGKMTLDRANMIFVAVNLDPFEPHRVEVEFPLEEMGVPPEETYEVEELLTGSKHLWRGGSQMIQLDPEDNPAAIFRITPWLRVDYREPCF